jgi:glycosyltransferase involved in cell wall biosynthesis
MGLETNAVIINQTDRYAYQEKEYGPYRIDVYDCEERGVGRSRNTALLRADADIVLFSDEDIVYDHGYADKIVSCFRKYKDADLLLFNLEVNEKRRTYWIQKAARVHRFNCGRYPTFCAAARLSKLRAAGVSFSLLFGGGAPFSNGEDSLFFTDCLRKGLKIYALPVKIGREEERESTWFHGYDEKFFRDRGVLFHFLYGVAAPLWALRFAVVKRREMCGEIPSGRALLLLLEGIREGKRLCRG